MKIKKLHFANHPFFGIIDINFSDDEGHPLNTVVLAGINGSGKTMIFNHIRELIKKGSISLSSGVDGELRYISDDTGYVALFLEETEREILEEIEIQAIADYIGEEAAGKTTANITKLFDQYAKAYQAENKEQDIRENLPKFIFLPPEIKFDQIKITNEAYKYDYRFLNQADENIAKFIPAYFATFIDKKVYDNDEIPPRESIRRACGEINAIFEKLDLESELVGLKKDGSRMPVFRNRNGIEFDITGLSSGEKQLFFRIMALKMFEADNSVILADEPEISLHPDWQQRILKIYENIGENNQVIVATHSPHIIASTHRQNVKVLTRNENTGAFQAADYDDIRVAKDASAKKIEGTDGDSPEVSAPMA